MTAPDRSPSLVAGSIVMLAAAASAPIAVDSATDLSPVRAVFLHAAFGTTALILGMGVFAMELLRRRVTREEAEPWVPAAAVLVGLAAAARFDVLGAFLPGDDWRIPMLTAVVRAAMLVALALFAAWAWDGGRGWSGRPGRVFLAAASVTAVLTALFRAVPDAAEVVSVLPAVAGPGAGGTALDVLVAFAWGVVAVGALARRRPRAAWVVILVSGLALSQVVAVAAGEAANDPWAVAGAALTAVGLLIGLLGSAMALIAGSDPQQAALLDAEVDAETTSVRERLREADVRRRRHDVANAMTTIEGAAMVLDRDHERLAPEDRALLREVLRSGSARLRDAMATEGSPPVSLRDAVSGVVAASPWADRVDADLPADLLVAAPAAETAEAVRQLLAYAASQSPAGPVVVRGERFGDRAVLRVGHGDAAVDGARRRPVGEEDSRVPAGAGDDVNVLVAARLVRAHGGELWVDHGGGFGLVLPVARAQGDDGTEL